MQNMSPPLSIEERMTQHELADQTRFHHLETKVEGYFNRIDGKLEMLIDSMHRTEDRVENTGSHVLKHAQDEAKWWKHTVVAWALRGIGVLLAMGAGALIKHYFGGH